VIKSVFICVKKTHSTTQQRNFTMSNQDRSIKAVSAFLQALNQEKMTVVIQQYPELLEEEINVVFKKFIEGARENYGLKIAAFIEQRYQALQDIHQHFKEKLSAYSEHLIEAANSFLQTSNAEEMLIVFQQYPELLEEEINVIFENAIDNTRKNNELEAVNIFEQRYQALRMIQQEFQQEFPQAKRDRNLFKTLVQQAKAAEQCYIQRGEVTGLDDAINLWEQILQHTEFSQQTSGFQLMVLNNSAVVYSQRYEATGQLSDLSIAISAWEATIEKTPPNFLYLAGYLNNLGGGLCNRYSRLGELKDLEKSIKYCQQAVEKTPPDSPDLPMYLNNLGGGLRNRYSRLGDLKDLQAGIEAHQQAVDLTQQNSPDSPNLPMYLSNLGNGLKDRYSRLGDLKDLQAGIEAHQQAVALTQQNSPNSPNLPAIFNSLGNGFRDRYEHLQHEVDLKQGKETFKQALQLEKNAPIADLLTSARNWLNWAFKRNSWEEMEESYPSIQNASRSLVGKQLSREHQEAFLKETQGISSKVAYSRIQRNDLKQAVEALEQGAARLLTIALLKTVSADVEHNTNIIFKAAQIRPLIYIFSTDKGGYALVVFQNEIKTIAFPELKNDILDKKLQTYFEVYNSHSKNFKAWRDKIEETTGWLWQIIWQPLSAFLPAGQKNITLIPNGILNLLPLHLAWTQKGDKKHYILDNFIINYAPNALSLETAKQRAKQRVSLKSNKLLAIDNSLGDLPISSVEVKNIAKHFSNATILSQHNAILEKVKNELEKDYNILHFSCHGTANFKKPLETALIMANQETLTVQDFLNAKLNARLVTLSACETGMIGTKLPEEVVNLPASLLQAGVAGVIASLWAVNDFSTALLMIKFYENFAQQSDNIALSLQQAQHWLRDSTNKDFLKYIEDHQLSLDATQKRPFRKNNPQDKPFQHCYYWGAFYVTGV